MVIQTGMMQSAANSIGSNKSKLLPVALLVVVVMLLVERKEGSDVSSKVRVSSDGGGGEPAVNPGKRSVLSDGEAHDPVVSKPCVPASVPLLSRVSFPLYALKLREYHDRHHPASTASRPFRVVEIGSLTCANVHTFRQVLKRYVPADLKIEFYSVDSWGHRGSEVGLSDHNDDIQGLRNYEYCQRMLNSTGFGDTQLIRRKSVEAAALFDDGFFDFVYIDALHTLEASWNDMIAWWPKCREGGLFAGDDYGDEAIVQLAKWGTVLWKPFRWGVVRAIERFANQYKVEVHVTSHEHKQHPQIAARGIPLKMGPGMNPEVWKPYRGEPNWYLVKPAPSFYDGNCREMIQKTTWMEGF